MDHNRKTKVVSGYATLKAAQRAAELARDKKKPPDKSEESAKADLKPPTDPTLPPKVGSHIGRTVMPTRLDVICYGCGYSFKMTGRTPSTHCPKCRSVVDLSDHIISSTWTGSVRTGGKIRIEREGVVLAGELIAGEILVEGEVRGGALKATGELQLAEGAVCSEKCFESNNLRILAGADIHFSRPIEFQKVVLLGKLSAQLTCLDLMEILAGGEFSGDLSTEHLRVELGGGLRGQMKVGDLESFSDQESLQLLKKPA